LHKIKVRRSDKNELTLPGKKNTRLSKKLQKVERIFQGLIVRLVQECQTHHTVHEKILSIFCSLDIPVFFLPGSVSSFLSLRRTVVQFVRSKISQNYIGNNVLRKFPRRTPQPVLWNDELRIVIF
jgi:hypothetical protein